MHGIVERITPVLQSVQLISIFGIKPVNDDRIYKLTIIYYYSTMEVLNFCRSTSTALNCCRKCRV